MKQHSTESIRTVALVGHGGAGKTTLCEALLLQGGAIGQAGSVERGTTVSDSDPLEKADKISLRSSVMHIDDCNGAFIHLVDTPGYPDFIGQSISALDAVKTAIIVVNASAGIERMTLRMRRWALDRKLCRMVVINKIDAENVDLPGVLKALRDNFGNQCLPINLPAKGGTEVVDCYFHPAAATATPDFSSVEEARQALIDQVVETDEELMARYLEQGEELTPEELHAPFYRALRQAHLVPVCFTSAKNNVGIQELLDIIVKLLPNPKHGNPPLFLRGDGPDAEPFRSVADADKHVLAHVFKIHIDPFVGKLSVFRVHQGTVRRDTQLFIGEARKPFKVAHLYILQGAQLIEVDQAVPGDIAAVAKVEEIHYGDVLHDSHDEDLIRMKPQEFPKPMHGLVILPAKRGDEQRLAEVLGKLVAEDPTLLLEQDATMNETVLRGLGESHLRSVLQRVQTIYKLDVQTRAPRVPFRETIAANAEGHHRHKKQTGGAGQFGEVMLRIEPLPRGAGFEFVDAVKGGVIPGQFIPAVQKGVESVLQAGPIAGFPMQDVRVTVYDGKHHAVDSKEIAFVTAGRKAFLDAIEKSRPTLLEPIVRLVVNTPPDYMGDISGDLSSRRGQITGTTTSQSGQMQIEAAVPLSELDGYSARLNSLTSGHARWTMVLSHYEAAPHKLQQQLAEEHQKTRKQEED